MVRCDLVSARFAQVDLAGARFCDTLLDDAVFEDCDLREADFGVKNELFADRNSTTNTIFRRCDLRGAKFAGRQLTGTEFVDCKLHNVGGAAKLRSIKVSGADLSPNGDGSVIGTSAQVEKLLG